MYRPDPAGRRPPDSEQLVYSTLLGGSARDDNVWELLRDIEATEDGRIAVFFDTQSTNLPLAGNSYQRAHGGNSDGFVAILDPSREGRAQLIYSSYLGGAGWEEPRWVRWFDDRTLILAGETGSTTGFPFTENVPFKGYTDIFLTTLDVESGRVDFSTRFGGLWWDLPQRCMMTKFGEVVCVGITASSDFPLANGFGAFGADQLSHALLFVFRPGLDGSPSTLRYSTSLGTGGGFSSSPPGELLDGLIEEEPGVYLVVGWTESPSLGVTESALQPQHAGGLTDIVLARIDTRFPAAAFDATPAAGPAPLLVSFDASPSAAYEGTELAGVFTWDFGDELSGEGKRVEHDYGAGPFGGVGRYLASLTVESIGGLASTVSREVTAYLESDDDLAPWSAIDLGSPRFPGGTRRSRETPRHDLELAAGGNGLSRSRAAFHFFHQEVNSDFELSAQVEALLGAEPGERASLGLMVRDGLGVATNTKHLALVVEHGSGIGANASPKVARHWRADRSRSEDLAELDAMGSWLRVTRQGPEFVCWTSEDGEAWTQLGGPVVIEELPETVNVGVALTKTEPSTQPSAFAPIVAGVSSLDLRGAPGETRFVRGDSNADGTVDIADPVHTLRWLFGGGEEPPCLDAAESDDSGRIELTDAIVTLDWLFGGGAAVPLAPFPDCGFDPTEDQMGCEGFPPCQRG